MPARLRSLLLVLASVLAGVGAATCGPGDGGGGSMLPWLDASLPPTVAEDAGPPPDPIPAERCHISLTNYVRPLSRGSTEAGARAKQIESAADLIGGPNAQGKRGDFLLSNDRIRVVVQGLDRHIGPSPYGGTILDADLAGEGPGRDQFGELGLLYNFGRTVRPTHFEVLDDGSGGGAAVVAASGVDSANDYLDIRSQLKAQLGRIPAADPHDELPLRITNYFILNPGEARVRMLTAFCNEGPEEVSVVAGEIIDPGYVVELFNGQSCTGGFGAGGLCFGIDSMSWFGYQGDGVAYAIAPSLPGAPNQPSSGNVNLTIAGITGSLHGAPGINGLTEWFSNLSRPRAGELRIPPGTARISARDFFVGRDLGELGSAIETTRAAVTGTALGQLSGRVTSGGRPLAGARVAVVRQLPGSGSEVAGVFVTQDDGTWGGRFYAGNYRVSAWTPGRAPSAEKLVSLTRNAPITADLELVEPRRLTVNVAAVDEGPIPAKVTVRCAGGTCPVPNRTLVRFTDTARETTPDHIQLVELVPVSGTVTVDLPPGRYQVLASRGPEYSVFPNDFPAVPGQPVDLRTSDATVDATLARVLDTTGYMSADLHVHAVNSPDSVVDNHTRALTFAAEGVDVLVATDHDVITDFAPYIRDIGASSLLASVVGQEASPMGFGHYNFFPVPRLDGDLTGGAMDWANPDGPTLTVGQMFRAARKMGALTVQVNHPRGALGGFSALQVDTDTLATRADPAEYSMAPQPGASPADTLLLSSDFNAIELLNSGADEYRQDLIRPLLNDWFTLLSRGLLVAGTGSSDTHKKYAEPAGYYRTFIKLGVDRPADFDAAAMSEALNGMKAMATNGPFATASAVRINGAGQPTSPPAGMGETLQPSANRNDQIEVTIDVQVPAFTDVSRIELYSWRPGDDGVCPIDGSSAQAGTTRVACDGRENRNWPQGSIAASADVTLSAADLKTIKTVGSTRYRRYQVARKFRLPAPARDNWIVALVYGSKPLFPLTSLANGGDVLPFALTNPILVDADGGGYDRPPFNSSLPPGRRPAPVPPERELTPPAKEPLTPERLLEAWGRMRSHTGGRGAH